MKKSKFHRYMMSVLTYYRSEWTDVSEDDKEYRLVVMKELEQLIRVCLRRGANVPNAAKEVEIFLDLENTRPDAEANLKPLPEKWNFDIKSSIRSEEMRMDPSPQDSDDEPDA